MYLNLHAHMYANIKFHSFIVETQILLSHDSLRRSRIFSIKTGVNMGLVVKGLQFEPWIDYVRLY